MDVPFPNLVKVRPLRPLLSEQNIIGGQKKR